MSDKALVSNSSGAKPSKNMKFLVQTEVGKKFQNYLFWIITVVLSSILGAIIALVIDLNSKISTIIGENKNQVEYVKILQERVFILEKENILLNEELKSKIKNRP